MPVVINVWQDIFFKQGTDHGFKNKSTAKLPNNGIHADTKHDGGLFKFMGYSIFYAFATLVGSPAWCR